MIRIATQADKRAVEAEMPLEARWSARSLYAQLEQTAARFPGRPALTFQLFAGPKARAVSLSWADLRVEVTRAANLLRRLGVGPGDCVAYVLPNGLEAPVVLLAGATAGVVNPINPLLSPERIAAILRDTGAKVVVTLAPFPRSDVAQRVAEAVAQSPAVETVVQVSLRPYLAAPASWIVPLIRPRVSTRHRAQIIDYRASIDREDGEALAFVPDEGDRVCACFHTGGTTGIPKIVQHRARGMLYNGWCGRSYMFTETDVLVCPLPMFHVFAAYPVFMSCLMTGAQMLMVTPQGYRGEGVYANFWKLVARHRVSFLIMVPTAAAKLMGQPVDADVSSLRYAISGSAPMPRALFARFEAATGVRVLEGYGMTEATCLVSINPPFGERRIGSVGLPFPYTDVCILDCDAEGGVTRVCGTDEAGEICVRGPGTVPGATYTEPEKNRGLYTADGFLRTGDLGRMDAEGYVWITGRAKDLIIRGGHNIDPAQIEEALLRHPEVCFAGAVGQPDARSGEVPAVYVELVAGAAATPEGLKAHAEAEIGERAALPRHVEVMAELPKTAVGKIFKPDLRRMAITRVYDTTLHEVGLEARVARVVEDPRIGLVAELEPGRPRPSDDDVEAALGPLLVRWRWRDEAGARRD